MTAPREALFVNPLEAPPPDSRNAGELIADILANHTDPLIGVCEGPPLSENHWCQGCQNTCMVHCAHCGEALLLVSSQYGTCPDCPTWPAAEGETP